MKTRAVLLMLLISFISYTGFAHSHSDPGQNSKAKVYTLSTGGDMLDMAVMPVIEAVQTDVVNEVTDLSAFTYTAGDVFVVYSGKHLYPPDSILCKKIPDSHWIYERTDTFGNLYLDRYRYKQYELIYVRVKQSGQHASKPRDKLIR